MVPPLSSIILARPKSAILASGGSESVRRTFCVAKSGVPSARSERFTGEQSTDLGLKVAVSDALTMAVGHADADLARDVLRLSLVHAGFGVGRHDEVEQVATGNVLEDEIDDRVVLEALDKGADGGLRTIWKDGCQCIEANVRRRWAFGARTWLSAPRISISRSKSCIVFLLLMNLCFWISIECT